MKKIEKRYVIWAFAYLIAGLLCGVYYREFTKALGYVNQYTPLGLVHPHLLVLGMIMSLLIGFLLAHYEINAKAGKWAFIIYNCGVIGSALMLLLRGTFDVLSKTTDFVLSSGANGAISGISGMFHILLAAGIVIYFIAILKTYKKKPEEVKDK